jgi:hypothetical protein
VIIPGVVPAWLSIMSQFPPEFVCAEAEKFVFPADTEMIWPGGALKPVS